MIDENTWIISDTHFGHKNIVRFCNRPWNHEELMLRNWASVVDRDDVVLHLGDVAFADVNYWCQRVAELPGKKYVIKGNHDHSRTVKILKHLGVEIIKPFVQVFDDKRIYFSHYPNIPVTEQWDINIHGHIHNNGYHPLLYLNPDSTKIYYNVSVEVMKYAPKKLSQIFSELKVAF